MNVNVNCRSFRIKSSHGLFRCSQRTVFARKARFSCFSARGLLFLFSTSPNRSPFSAGGLLLSNSSRCHPERKNSGQPIPFGRAVRYVRLKYKQKFQYLIFDSDMIYSLTTLWRTFSRNQLQVLQLSTHLIIFGNKKQILVHII